MFGKLVILAMTLLPGPAWAWGAEGHEIVAGLAARELSPQARAEIGRLLGGEAGAMMVHGSNWADEIREQRPETGPWHYVDIPLQASGYVAARDCPYTDCVVAQIGADARVLGNRRLADAQRAEALLFLIHFVGDVHQPMHAVDNDDKGGNAIRVYAGRDRTNMHHLWDQQLVEILGLDAGRIAAALDAGLSPQRKAQIARGTAADWANQSFQIARSDVYGVTQGRRNVDLPNWYERKEAPVVRAQLAAAGVRLAWMLNTILR